jgi:hypothetical protein
MRAASVIMNPKISVAFDVPDIFKTRKNQSGPAHIMIESEGCE